MNRTAIIAQARMGSSRLPGKVLAPLGGATALEHVMRRARMVSGADAVCLATTILAEDDPVAERGTKLGVHVHRGPAADVLGRYAGAAEALGADVIMRITCDCPLLDPDLCRDVLALRAARNADYASNVGVREWPQGLDCEAFTRAMLEEARTQARDAYDREHVTPWIRGHARASAHLQGPGGEAARQRWVLDYPEDLEFLAAVFERLPMGATSWRDVLSLVESDREIVALDRKRRHAVPALYAGESTA